MADRVKLKLPTYLQPNFSETRPIKRRLKPRVPVTRCTGPTGQSTDTCTGRGPGLSERSGATTGPRETLFRSISYPTFRFSKQRKKLSHSRDSHFSFARSLTGGVTFLGK